MGRTQGEKWRRRKDHEKQMEQLGKIKEEDKSENNSQRGERMKNSRQSN